MITSNFEKFSFKTTIGTCTLFWDEQGLRALQLEGDKRKNSKPPAWILKLSQRIEAHLKGYVDDFLDVSLQFEKRTEFQKKVYSVVRHIPSGKVLTYKEVASKAGSPLACRAIGQIMSRNPFALIIPCHRVIGTGQLGGFSGGKGNSTKIHMLKIEGYTCQFDSNKVKK